MNQLVFRGEKQQRTELIIRRHEIEQLIAEAMKHACSDRPKKGFPYFSGLKPSVLMMRIP